MNWLLETPYFKLAWKNSFGRQSSNVCSCGIKTIVELQPAQLQLCIQTFCDLHFLTNLSGKYYSANWSGLWFRIMNTLKRNYELLTCSSWMQKHDLSQWILSHLGTSHFNIMESLIRRKKHFCIKRPRQHLSPISFSK